MNEIESESVDRPLGDADDPRRVVSSPLPEVATPSEHQEHRARIQIQSFFEPLFAGTGGIDSWLSRDTPDDVFDRLLEVNADPLPRAQLNQLLVLSNEAGVSDGFFEYYFLHAPEHTYDVRAVPGYFNRWLTAKSIVSLDQLKWGLYRFYTDALLYFGNIRSAYRYLRDLDFDAISEFFTSRRIDSEALSTRGAALPLKEIARDDRYLISEMACKSFIPRVGELPDLRDVLLEAYSEHSRFKGRRVTARDLLTRAYERAEYKDLQMQFDFSADSILDEEITSLEDLESKVTALVHKFTQARDRALENTRLYLSMIEELDVYVATSMRTREDFRDMAAFCDHVFLHPDLRHLNIRYFDPTLSAADGHEDKGLIECLMVKCAKALVYSAGSKESFGKDAEAAMALSLGKPVIFYCDDEQRRRFYRDVHPLSRLIEFQTGIPVGAMVTSSQDDVVDLLARIFENRMEYTIEQPRPGHLQLKEKRTSSVVRLQTSDLLLRETFWNYYHRTPERPESGPGVGAPRRRRPS